MYIHPTSVLFRQKPLPDYVVYTELHKTPKKTYIKGITVISPSWLPNLSKNLCDVNKVLPTPEPYFDAQKDVLMCHTRPAFSGGWSLPPQHTSYPESLDAYKYFARELLSGKVFPYFTQFQGKLTAQPSLATSAWNIKKVNSIVEALASRQIRTKKSLEQAWQKNPTFLLESVQLWILSSSHHILQESWPPTK